MFSQHFYFWVKLIEEPQMRILQVHSQESEVSHSGLLKYQDFPSQSLPQIGLTQVSSKNFRTILKLKCVCV